MAANANPKVVGGFVVGAIALLVLAVALFGGGNLFVTRPRAGTYFQGSVAGLEVGAPVTYQGVRVGEVKSIRLEVDNATLTPRMPVEFDFIPGAVKWSDRPLHPGEFQRLIERGLRAKLVSQSLVTGLLAIELGYYPDTTAKLVGGLPPPVIEIPSVQSDLESLKKTLGSLPLDQIANSLVEVLARADTLLADPEWRSAVTALAGGMQAFKALMTTANDRSRPLLDDVGDIAKETETAVKALQADLQAAIADLRGLVGKVDGEVKPLSARVQAATSAAEKAFQQADGTLRTVNAALDPRSPLRNNLEQTLANLSVASKSLRSFADQLDRSPNVLITGR
ncbi:paraquat-inducible protein B [Azospirillum sp. OGB3]|uniref:MlaD family protein n=1 Tax=Azospirillum sp. OGB3 TaxID=2587012 RepID=UPI0016060555|nr:MlaD family protein [Azospirillum sp. OGB3]MBB3268258.1 paraquat-inducible protein B [Azospirillum sp. OGB3]